MKHFLALFLARNREFYRDKGSLAWSLMFPLILIFGLNFALSSDKYVYQVGVITTPTPLTDVIDLPWLEVIPYTDQALAVTRLEQHQIQLLLKPGAVSEYWINESSKKAWFLEQALEQNAKTPLTKHVVSGEEISYVAWVVPGILSMSLMFSCLYGVGYVIVRYRDLGILKRFKATPISAFEFLSAQLLSRLIISVATLGVVFVGSQWLLGFPMHGSYLLLALVATMGALTMIALSLLCAARIDSLEFMNGLLNFISWPMILLSGLWFSLDNAPVVLQFMTLLMPLTHVVEAARAVMLQGAGFTDIADHLFVLGIMSALLLALATKLFRWQKG